MPEAHLTLVAFHGAQKPEPLRKLLRDVSGELGSRSPRFESYSMGQMHATLIGMEADVVEGRLCGRWFRTNRQELREISIAGFHRVITERVAAGGPLFRIRFGGFAECFCTCRSSRREACEQWACATAPLGLGVFHSCDRTPYEGSFYAVAPGPAVITGWPSSFTHELYEFRRSLERAGFADKYHYDATHEKAHWKNDDCFIRVGTFREALSVEELRQLQHGMRTFLSKMTAVVVDIDPADVSIVSYVNPSLHERDVVARVPLPMFLDDPSSLKRLYDAALKRS